MGRKRLNYFTIGDVTDGITPYLSYHNIFEIKPAVEPSHSARMD